MTDRVDPLCQILNAWLRCRVGSSLPPAGEKSERRLMSVSYRPQCWLGSRLLTMGACPRVRPGDQHANECGAGRSRSLWDGLAFGVASTEDSSYRAAKYSSSIRWMKV